MHIDRIRRAVPSQLARSQDGGAKKFQFKDVVPGIQRYSRLVNAIDWLIASELIIKIPIIHSAEISLSVYTEESRFKCFMSDVGLLGAMSNLPFQSILNYDFGTYKGYFAENFVAQALFTAGKKNLYAWQDNRSEIEFVLMHNNAVLPAEVKSGWITREKSLQKFAAKFNPPYITIMSGHSLKIDTRNNIHHYPLYLAGKFPLPNFY